MAGGKTLGYGKIGGEEPAALRLLIEPHKIPGRHSIQVQAGCINERVDEAPDCWRAAIKANCGRRRRTIAG